MRLRRSLAALIVCLMLGSVVLASDPALDSEEDKVLYTLGVALSRNLVPFEFSEQELALVQAGLIDGVNGRDPRVPLEVYGPRIDPMLQARMARLAEKEQEAGAAFRIKAAEEPGAQASDSGLVYLQIEAGDGPSPGAQDTVKLHYHGTLSDGTVFDSSREKEPVSFNLGAVIGCFSEGVQKMKVGGKSKLTCPPEIAYGDRGSPPLIRPGATIQFEIELLEIVPAASCTACALIRAVRESTNP